MAGVNVTELALRIAALEEQLAAVTSQTAETNESLDNIWMLYSASLIFFMNPGFAFLEAGSVRFKNAQHILAKNVVVPVVCFLVWYVLGYGLAFGKTLDPNYSKFAGGRWYAFAGFWEDKTRFRNWFFQGCFCETAATIVSGCTAERTHLWAYIVYVVFMTGIIYPIVVYWGWSGGGWLNFPGDDGVAKSAVGPPYMDFAGSGIIHMVGGVGGLVGAIMVGPRKDRFNPEKAEEFAPHSMNFIVLGTFILWFGWYGFNPGSTGAMHDSLTAARSALVACNTSLAACTAGLLVFVLRLLLTKKHDVGALCNGILAGLVAVTAGCAFIEPWEAICIGFIGGLVYQGCSMLIPRLKIDDPVEAVSVHLANGLWGIIAIGFFGDPAEGWGGNGVFYGGNQLGVQIVAAIVFAAWTVGLSVAVFLPLKLLGALRTPDDIQDIGIDAAEHSPGKSYITDEVASPSKVVEA